jgi:adenine C2-methylase RlmN of 23S rRNA A2503 and tRNA A37
MNPSDAYHLLAFAFGAGGAWFLIRQSRKDVNGLGSKMNAEIKQATRQHLNVALALMLVAQNDDQREKIAALLKEPE